VCPLGVSITIRLACILLILVACAVPLHAEGCGVASLFDFCELVGERPNRDQREQIVEGWPMCLIDSYCVDSYPVNSCKEL